MSDRLPRRRSISRRRPGTNQPHEDRIYARFPRRRGSVLVVGVGAVGSRVARELASAGISPLYLLDKDVLEIENIARHELGEPYVGWPKAEALADHLSTVLRCESHGIFADFTTLPPREIRRLLAKVDLVVAATDSEECQRRINEFCLAAEKPAVYPGVHVDANLRDAEMAEVLWVLPGQNTPCYMCVNGWRPVDERETEVRGLGGTGTDLLPLIHATAATVLALLAPDNPDSHWLDPDRNLLYVHTLKPVSPSVRNLFERPLDIVFADVDLPERCEACGLPQAVREEEALQRADEENRQVRRQRQTRAFTAIAALIVAALVIGIPAKLLSDAREEQRQEQAIQDAGEQRLRQATAAATSWSVAAPEEWRHIWPAADLLVVELRNALIAFRGGKRVWRHKLPQKNVLGCDTQVLGAVSRRVVVLHDATTFGLDTKNGKTAWTVPGGDRNVSGCDSVALVGNTLLQIESGSFGYDALAAYSVVSGRLQWRTYAGQRTIITTHPVSVNDYLVVGNTVVAVGERRIVALNRSSGHLVWRLDRDGDVQLLGADRLRLFIWETPPYSNDLTIMALQISSGRTIWKYDAPARNFREYDSTGTLPKTGPLVLMGRDGYTVELSRATGKIVRKLRLDAIRLRTDNLKSEGWRVYSEDGTILDTKTGEVRAAECDEGEFVFDKGVLLCLDSQLLVLDPVTGKVKATLALPDPEAAVVAGSRLAFVAHSDGGGRRLLTAIDLMAVPH